MESIIIIMAKKNVAIQEFNKRVTLNIENAEEAAKKGGI